MAITLKQLRYFVALSETLNFGRAAALVHVSQPALSMQIRELEAMLGTPLIERRPRDVRLTRAGRDLVERAQRILAETREIETSVQRRGLQGRLNLGVIPTVAPYLLPEALARLRRGGAARDLRVREARTHQLLDALDGGQIDAAVIATPASAPQRVSSPLFEDRFVLAGTAARLAAMTGQGPPAPVMIEPEQLLLLDEGHCLADQALEVCAFDRREARVDLGAASLATLCGLVAQGFGLTLLPEISLRTERAAAPELAVTRFAQPEPTREIALVRRATTAEEGWFTELAEVLRAAGGTLIAHAREIAAPVPLDTGANPDYV